MRILFDQGAPVPIAAYLSEHTVRTALEKGWDTLVSVGDVVLPRWAVVEVDGIVLTP